MVLGYRTRVVRIEPELVTCKYFDSSDKYIWRYVSYFEPGPTDATAKESDVSKTQENADLEDELEDGKDELEDGKDGLEDEKDGLDKLMNYIDEPDNKQLPQENKELKKLIFEDASVLLNANTIASIDKSIADIKAMP